jgi:hypothetical protein
MMQKEGGAPFCILYTRSIGTAEFPVKNNLSIYINMKSCLDTCDGALEKPLTVVRIDYNIHKIYRHLLRQEGNI